MSNQIDPNCLFRIFDVWQQLNVGVSGHGRSWKQQLTTLPENGWLEDDPFLLGPGLFSGVNSLLNFPGSNFFGGVKEGSFFPTRWFAWKKTCDLPDGSIGSMNIAQVPSLKPT